MEYKDKIEMMELNNEIGELSMSKDEVFPEESIFKQFQHRYLAFRPAEWMLQKLLKRNIDVRVSKFN